MMDNTDDPEEGLIGQENEMSGLPSPSSSFGSSLGASSEFQRMLKPPNKKKYEEEMETVLQDIKIKEAELKALGGRSPDGVRTNLDSIRAEKEANISKRKKVDEDLKQLNLNIQKLRGSLSSTESNLHYKSEAKIDEAIRKLEYQLKVQNFKLIEERKIVAEIDKMKRSKKVLVQYFSQKRDLDDARAKQNRLRGEREYLYKSVTTLKNREDEMRKSRQFNKTRSEELKKEIDELYSKKRKLFADFKQHETDYTRLQKEHKKAQRKESFKKREEEKRAKEMAYRKEMLEFEAQKEPFEDEKNLCNTLMSYLQRYTSSTVEGADLASPREEQPDPPIAAAGPSIADSLDDGMFVLLKKSDSEERDYSISNKRPNSRRGRKGRKTSVTKPLAHTPQIIAQFASLNLNAPSNVSEIAASMEQLLARKRYYDEHAATVPRPILGSLSGSFSSSGSISSLESPMRERSSTWGFVEVPPPIMENQTLSDCGRSAESGFHDMSRQASKTESSESAAENQQMDHALDEIIQQSAEYGESEHSRSSSDTVTPEDHITEDIDYAKDNVAGSSHEHRQFSLRDGLLRTSNQFMSHDITESQSISHDNDSAVFEMGLIPADSFTGDGAMAKSSETQNTYDLEFPAALNVIHVTKEKSQAFLGEPDQISLPGNTDNKLLLPSKNSDTMTLPGDKGNDTLLPSNTDSVLKNNQHPGDADFIPEDDKLIDLKVVPASESDATNYCVPVSESNNGLNDMTVSVSNPGEDTSFHIQNQDDKYFHHSATENSSETDTICEPQAVDNSCDGVNVSDKLQGAETNSETDSYLLCDKNENCDNAVSADSYQYCDGVLDELEINLDESGIECKEGAGKGCIEGASGFEDSLGASGIESDIQESAQDLDPSVGEETSI